MKPYSDRYTIGIQIANKSSSYNELIHLLKKQIKTEYSIKIDPPTETEYKKDFIEFKKWAKNMMKFYKTFNSKIYKSCIYRVMYCEINRQYGNIDIGIGKDDNWETNLNGLYLSEALNRWINNCTESEQDIVASEGWGAYIAFMVLQIRDIFDREVLYGNDEETSNDVPLINNTE
ncbi:MAG: hypothetical protein RL095_1405 [Verrucomicrobiota bacterium]|jgi:hypothetical protein